MVLIKGSGKRIYVSLPASAAVKLVPVCPIEDIIIIMNTLNA